MPGARAHFGDTLNIGARKMLGAFPIKREPFAYDHVHLQCVLVCASVRARYGTNRSWFYAESMVSTDDGIDDHE